MLKPATFSIVALDPKAKELGVAVQSKFLSVGSVVPWVQAGIGAIATQSWANTSYGPRGLELLHGGATPQEAINALVADDEHAQERQIGIVDAHGRSATYTGANCKEWAGGTHGINYAAQGNILAGAAVVESMVDAFEATKGHLADRLLAGLRAAQAAGGDRRGQQSAAIYVAKPGGGYGGFNDRYVDIRVDDHPRPIEELARILESHKLYFFKPLPHEVVPIDDRVGTEIAALLAQAGELPRGSAFDSHAREVFVAFMHRENLEDRVRDDGSVDVQTLEYLRAFRAR
ncbi:MAG: DUF1028 domain-containing protein [Candidatus Eremiobacteraeota bacterium]|nr:DUF1028 domain-containing protein [Candidatus Eremiobacteraeota bacterium]MBV8222021.1 DUF1028 domain-containing protein [Candidatus Eremiobacteraeota bacterium]